MAATQEFFRPKTEESRATHDGTRLPTNINSSNSNVNSNTLSKAQSLAILFDPSDFLAAHHPAADYVARQFGMRSDRALLIARLHWGER